MSQKISQFTQITTLASGDFFPVVQASGVTNKSIQVGALDERYFIVASGNFAQSTANTALASGNAGISTGLTALASGNAALTSAALKLPLIGGILTGDLTLNAQSDLRLADSDSSNYVAIQAASVISSNVTFTAPSADGTNGQVLTTNGTGTLSFTTAAGGGSQWTTTGSDIYYTTGKVGIGSTLSGNANNRLLVRSESASAITNVLLLNNGAANSNAGQGVRLNLSGISEANSDIRYAYIEAATQTTGNDHYLAFGTNAPSVTPAERARIDSSGRLLVGTSTATGANLLQVNSDALVNGITVGRGLASVSSNTAVGSNALAANTTGSDNVALGNGALQVNTTGGPNTAIGLQALVANTTGSENVAVGYRALRLNTTTGSNTSVGTYSMYNATDSTLCANVGTYSLYDLTTGDQNTAIGYDSGRVGTTGSNNTCLGYQAHVAASSTSNTVTLGNSSVATLRCQVTTITALSDARDKTNITNIPAGLDFINALRPVAFDWNMRDGGKVGIREFGFIAQELQEVQASTGITVPNLVSTENPDKLEASPGVLLPILVNAVKQLSAQNAALEARLAALETA